ncbi:MAG: hypothetical protein PHV37_01090 [Candidatus Gastranaerophilales bacterium]|nr:hypothetical protein [Candidatus Gastranaerophilales bacterium]
MAKDSGKRYRDAATGQYVTKSYADKNPKTTISESVLKDKTSNSSGPKDGTKGIVRKNKK